MLLGLFGAALLFGDGIITPAISVLSAIEGLKDGGLLGSPPVDAAAALLWDDQREWLIMGITIVILIVLFSVQFLGTANVGRFFGPITLAWFLTIAALGVSKIVGHPEILGALNPLHALRFMWGQPGTAFIILGAVVLAVTLGYASRLRASWLVRGVHRLAGLGYALPGTVIAVGVLIPVSRFDNMLTNWLSQNFGWDSGLVITGGLTGLVYACVVRFLTPAVQSVDAGLQKITPSMDNAARSLGLTPSQTLRRVHFPLLRGSLLTAGLLVFIDVMKELPATLVMRPFNFDTLATQAYTLASDERLAEASTSALAIVVVGLLPMIFLSREIAKARQGQAG